MNLPLNLFDNDVNIQTFLCQADKTRIGEISPYSHNATLKFNSYSVISFDIDKYYNDLFDGTTKINPYYELVDSVRVIEIGGVGHFVIQDVGENEGDTYTKSVTCFSLEYTTGQKYLENFYINTGEEGSVETMYHAQQYGAEYSIDNYYALVNESDEFDPYQRYYIKKYSADNTASYDYVETQILDENSYTNYEFDLYIKKYPNVRFYWPTKPELSLLHLVFDRIPEWKIGHVDKELWYQERTFSENKTSVYDFLYRTAADTFSFIMVWDSINGVCNFYHTREDGLITDNYVKTNIYNPNFIYYLDNIGTVANPQPNNESDVVDKGLYVNIGQSVETQWDTDVFISRENLVSSLDITYSTDDIKTKLKITGSDTLDIRDVNLGQNYILDLSFYNDELWMGKDLSDKYTDYTNLVEDKTKEYKDLISEWSASYNEYNDLMNHVPAEPRVMLVGDEFEKLYCVYNQYKPAPKIYDSNLKYFKYNTQTLKYDYATPNVQEFKEGQYYVVQDLGIDDNIDPVKYLAQRLQTKLSTYKVDQNSKGEPAESAKLDDVLLTLENDVSDSATIRVRYAENKTDYRVYRTYTSASEGISNTISFSLEEWVGGQLTANYRSKEGQEMNLEGFRIKSIGTLGAYFCLTRDETEEANLEDYGIRLLEEKQNVYTKIFITQTEGYMNEEGSQCVTSNEEPKGNEYPIGTKWLDTNNTKPDGSLIMKERTKSGWKDYVPDNNDYENYARFYENYVKLGNVQTVMGRKQRVADYLLNGVPMNALYLTDNNVNLNNLFRVAIMHFIAAENNYYVTNGSIPSGNIEEGAVWFTIKSDTLNISAQKYHSGKWENYNPDVHITLDKYDSQFGFIVFTVNTDTENKYAVYVINGIPYVSYARSQGLCLAKMDTIKNTVDMNTYFNEYELARLSPFIREDEYSDSNFLLTGYESEEEQMNIKQELLNAGREQLNKIRQPKLSFNVDMDNILSIPEFSSLRKQFKLGNFIRVGIRDNIVKRARLLQVQINFDDPSDFSATFGDLISTKSEIDKHADLLQQAVTAGKSVASNQSKWQRGADKATALDQAINDGLKNAALSVGAADGQAIVWDRYGIRGRKLKDGSTDEYEPQQFALINNKLVFTDDNWETSRAVVGEFEITLPDPENSNQMVPQKMYGLMADALVGGYIQGTEIFGGSLEIGDGSKNLFSVDKEGNVTIKQGGKNMYEAISTIDAAYKYSIQLSYTGNAVFSDPAQSTIITAKIFRRGIEVTGKFKDKVEIHWIRSSNETDIDWKPIYTNTLSTKYNKIEDTYQIKITNDDIPNTAQISCYIEPDDDVIAEIENDFND
jgi:hypothetical protein